MRFYIAGKSKNTWGQLTKEERRKYKKLVAQRDGEMCSRKNGHGCGKAFSVDKLTLDHICPISMGGPVCDIDNMQLLCKKCHARKTKRQRLF